MKFHQLTLASLIALPLATGLGAEEEGGVPEVVLPTLPELPEEAADEARNALDHALDNAERALESAERRGGNADAAGAGAGAVPGEGGLPDSSVLPNMPELPDAASDEARQALDNAMNTPSNILDNLPFNGIPFFLIPLDDAPGTRGQGGTPAP